MKFSDIIEQVRTLLQRESRLSYRILKREFALNDEDIEDLKAELIDAKRVAVDEDGKVLAWATPVSSSPQPLTPSTQHPSGERRQLTVMFCDLVGSTALSTQLDPEELREVVRSYQQTSAAVIERFGGHIAQYLGDGLLVYFGYPVAHEDDAVRAVCTGLEIVQAIRGQVTGDGLRGRQHPLQVRIGIHTGPVVVGEMGGGAKREQLALGETPNIAARVQGQAEPDMVVISEATHRLVEGLFECEDYGRPTLKGIATPLTLYRVVKEGEAQSRFEAAMHKGLTPLVGRAEEFALLQRCWTQAKDGTGQVVLLSGEPGIGKSRLVQEFKQQLGHEGVTRLEFRCSPYHQNSALYPIIDHLQHLLQFAREDAPTTRVEKLQHTLSHYRFPRTDTVPLLAALLSLPHPEGYPLITFSPQKQKEQTQAALVAWLVEEAEKAPVSCTWEDVHWADPSTLEVLTLLLDQVSTTRLFAMLTFRPEFIPPWGNRSHLNQITLSRLRRGHVEAMVERVTGGKALPVEVVQQIVAKTDGVPLFVEELTKTVIESGLLREEEDRYVGAHGGAPISSLAIPSTLQDSLMARLDRLAPVKELAQLGATLGREFSYELLHAVSPLDEGSLQQGLRQLVEVELLYQRGVPPQATYLFKHALIQDTAYQSLLKSKRQQYHQQIAKVLEERFPDTKSTQPELLAHHYTEAGRIEHAIPCWQKAGQNAVERSANSEAISHLTKGLELLKTLPNTVERAQQELSIQLAMNLALLTVKGYAAPEVGETALRARKLCQQLGETPQLFSVLFRLAVISTMRGELQTALELAEQLMRLAQNFQDQYFFASAHTRLGGTLFLLGEFTSARTHLEQAMALYNLQTYPPLTVNTHDSRVECRVNAAFVLWYLGYPEQALKWSQESTVVAEERSFPFALALALGNAALFHLLRRERPLAQERADAVMTLSTEQGFPHWLAIGTMVHGWALAEQGHVEEGIAQMCHSQISVFFIPCELAQAYKKVGQVEKGLTVLTMALAFADKTGVRVGDAELYRLKGELTLQSKVQGPRSKVEEAEGCFWKAIEIARQQQAKSLELRAAMSLARLWHQQGKNTEAHQLLSAVYHWFSEGFDTKDLQEAKALIEELSH